MATVTIIDQKALSGSDIGADESLAYNSGTNTLTAVTIASDSYQLGNSAIVLETGTARTLSATDDGKIIACSNAANVTVTTAAGLRVGFTCTLLQLGAGKVSLANAASTTRASYGSLFGTAGQYASITVMSPSANSFIVLGMTG